MQEKIHWCWFLQLSVLGMFIQWVCVVGEARTAQGTHRKHLLWCITMTSDLRVRKSDSVFVFWTPSYISQWVTCLLYLSASAFCKFYRNGPAPFSEKGRMNGYSSSIFGRKLWHREWGSFLMSWKEEMILGHIDLFIFSLKIPLLVHFFSFQ